MKYSLKDSSGNDYGMIPFNEVQPGIISLPDIFIWNESAETPAATLLGACNTKGNFTGGENFEGKEAVAEKWLEAKLGAGSWTPIGGDYSNPANVLSITPPVPGSFTQVSLRLNIPSDTDTGGEFGIMGYVV